MKAYIYVVDNILMFEVLLGYFVETVWSNLLKASRKMPVGILTKIGKNFREVNLMKSYIYVIDNFLMFEVLLGYFVETVWSNLLKASRKML